MIIGIQYSLLLNTVGLAMDPCTWYLRAGPMSPDLLQERVCVYIRQAPSQCSETEERSPQGESAERGTHSSETRVIYVDCPSQETTRATPPSHQSCSPAHLTDPTGTDPAEVSAQGRINISTGRLWIWWLKWQALTYIYSYDKSSAAH